MQYGGRHQPCIAAIGRLRDQIRHLGKMVHIGLLAFALAPLMDMALGRYPPGFRQKFDIVHHFLSLS